ncbi:somatomedin-B and thrombospondin type-1 domain-containing protein [Lepeophtheirus salmonis]|uniref:somatomedin-B and thrombospondin type-1 domain-containing protein n=1 Tax=Lepeophtheirus salmonis TaxID=72036 RepID=UPI001AE6947D|nr:somatomedin-B and thrombospondin type-1 domain-containing protein-like [Lepeophtheirus salmonis]
MILAYLLLLFIGNQGIEGSCYASGMCCPGRDSSCGVQNDGGKRNETCYCDEGCLETGDCCSDYEEYCDIIVTDCVTSDWSEWSECNQNCGVGVKSRSRVIVQYPSPGGKSCGSLNQNRRCVGQRCSMYQRQYKSPIGETAGLLSAKFLNPKKHKSSWDIRENLFLHNEWNRKEVREDGYQSDEPQEQTDDRNYCIVFELVKVSKACVKDDDFHGLHQGEIRCALCTDNSRHKSLGDRCRGHGVPSKLTRWRSTIHSRCHGKWKRKHETRDCRKLCPHGADFIFV